MIRLEFAADTPAELEELVREGLAADAALVAESAGFIGDFEYTSRSNQRSRPSDFARSR